MSSDTDTSFEHLNSNAVNATQEDLYAIFPTQEFLDLQASAGVRAERDTILENDVEPLISDSVRWGELTTEEQNAWSQYRTDLLNISDQAGFPHNVTWPTRP